MRFFGCPHADAEQPAATKANRDKGLVANRTGELKGAALAVEHAKCAAGAKETRFRIQGEPGLLLVVSASGRKS